MVNPEVRKKQIMNPLYKLKRTPDGHCIFKGDDTEPFDGPMTKEQGETLVQNLNETPEPDENDENPIIRDFVEFTNRLQEELDPTPVLVKTD